MRQSVVKEPKKRSAEEALASLMRLCARAEKSSGDARRLMRGWGVEPAAQESVLRQLIAQRFIDDERYAAAFVREKVNLSGWGAYKIRAALARKGVEERIINAALQNIDSAKSAEQLSQRLQRKMRTTKAASEYELKTKLMRYGASLGYDFETVREAVDALIKTTDERCDIF